MAANHAVPEVEQEVETGKPATKRPRRYNVVVLNDDDHTFNYVVEMLLKVFHYEIEKCVQLTKEIDQQGRAIVWTGYLEPAEFKRDQVKSFGPDKYAPRQVDYSLGVELEPAD